MHALSFRIVSPKQFSLLDRPPRDFPSLARCDLMETLHQIRCTNSIGVCKASNLVLFIWPKDMSYSKSIVRKMNTDVGQEKNLQTQKNVCLHHDAQAAWDVLMSRKYPLSIPKCPPVCFLSSLKTFTPHTVNSTVNVKSRLGANPSRGFRNIHGK